MNNHATSTHQRQQGPKWSINDVLRSHKGRYVGIHLGQDFGMITREKNNDVVRIGYGNINGFPAVMINNPKVLALKKWMRKYDVDGFFGAEGNVNWKKMPTDGQLPEFFRSENALRMVAAYNLHKNYGRKQQGGTFSLAFGQLASAVKNVGVDNTGLGQWSWMLCQGRDGHKVWIVVAYQPCPSKATQLGTIWQQHRRYLLEHGHHNESPPQAFCKDLTTALKSWRHKGECLILFMDANEDTTNSELNSVLMGDTLQMREAVHTHHPSLPVSPMYKSSG